MKNSNVVQVDQFREVKKEARRKEAPKKRSLGASIYPRNGILWVDFRYLGQRVRESSGLPDNSKNRHELQKQLNLIISEIKAACESSHLSRMIGLSRKY